MRTKSVLLATSLFASACRSAPPEAKPPPPDPAEVEAQAVAEATDLCMQGIQRKADVRTQAIDQLTTVTATYPDNARAFFFLGMCNLLTVAEDGNIGAVFDALTALERANELDPADTRTEGNLWITRFNIARTIQDKAGIDAALAGLTTAVGEDVFNSFVASLAFSNMDLASGYPAQAVKSLETLHTECPTLDYCKNSPIVLHHDAALYMQTGDAYTRVGDKANAVDAYTKALSAPGVDSWTVAGDAKAWADGVDARILLYSGTDPNNYPPYFLSGPRTCSGCHG
jgi:hypothetical protein